MLCCNAAWADAHDDIRVEGGLGTIEPEAVEQLLGVSARSAVDACFRDGLATFPYLRGDLRVRARVGKTGNVTAATTVTPLGSVAVENCVVGVVRRTRFPAPRGGREAQLEYAWHFDGARPVASFDAGDTDGVFAANVPSLKACLHRVPRGLQLVVVVGPGGRAQSVGVGNTGPETIDARAALCIAGAVERWRFPDPLGRMRVAAWSPVGAAR